jgi:hypothetical protein
MAVDEKDCGKEDNCPRCGEKVHCGARAGKSTCWCADLPYVMPMDPAAACLCKTCLEKEIALKTKKPS